MTTWLPASNQDDTVSDQIFDMVKAYLDDSQAASAGCTDASNVPDAPVVPISQFSSVLDIGIPDPVPFSPHAVPTDGAIDTALSAPVYDGNYQDIATIALQDITTALYGAYALPRSLTEHDVGDPDLSYPEAAFSPVHSDAGLIDIPAPVIQVGETPTFLEVPTISFELSDLAPVDAVVPAPPTLEELELLEQPVKFDMVVSQGLLDAIDAGLAGVEVLGFPEQQIMIDRDKRPLDVAFDRAERAAFDKSAASGFFATTGPLLDVLSKLAYDASFKDREVFEAVRGETYERAIKHINEAVKAALVLEATNGAVHLNYASKLVQTLKFNVAMQAEYAGLLVTAFNEQLKGVRALVGSYQSYASTVVAEYNAYTRAVLAQTAVLDTNSAKVTVYGAQVGTIEVQAGVYSAEVEHRVQALTEYEIYVKSILKNVDLARVNIEAFSQSIKGYGQAIDADTAMIDAYATQVRATGSATGVYEANYDAYADTLSAKRGSNEARQSWYSSSLQALSGEISEFQSAAQAQRAYLGSLTDWTKANASVHSQYATGVSAESSYIQAYNRHSISLAESQSNIDLAREDAKVRMDALEAQAIALQESINIGLTAAEATTSAGCAQAAYSVRSVSAGMRATAGMVDSGAANASNTVSTSTNRSYAYRKTRSINT